MKLLNRKMAVAEVECPGCNGTGFPPVKPSLLPGRKIFAARCKECLGKGRLTLAPE
jgi:DnaJ-class molecular chaperone